MRHIHNWDAIQERQDGDYNNPVPGGYVAKIIRVEDLEDKEYLAIEWDFAEGQYKGANQATYDRANFWPTIMRRSYKESAIGFFKGFKTAVEMSNPNYTFDDRRVQDLDGRLVGLVLGEEEYTKNNGTTGTRLYVHSVRSVRAIRDGDYKVPELKKLAGNTAQKPFRHVNTASVPENFSELEDDGELPF